MNPIHELAKVVKNQKTIRTTRLAKIHKRNADLHMIKDKQIKRLTESNSVLNQRAQRMETKYVNLRRKTGTLQLVQSKGEQAREGPQDGSNVSHNWQGY